MSMAVGSADGGGDDEVMSEMNTTPLIDVMLVLLIMLIITIPIQTHAVKLDLPAGHPPPPPVPPTVVTIDVDFDNSLLWDGATITDPDLVAKLKGAAMTVPQPEIHLRPNKLASYGTVAHVMADVQKLGIRSFGLVGSEQFVQ